MISTGGPASNDSLCVYCERDGARERDVSRWALAWYVASGLLGVVPRRLLKTSIERQVTSRRCPDWLICGRAG